MFLQNVESIASFDMSPAFDTIDCSLALKILSKAQFPAGFVKWLESYFRNRSGGLRVKGRYSSEIRMSKGVPQGSVLGPPIFSAYIKDIKSSTLNVTTIKYADDINLIIPLTSSTPDNITKLIDHETNIINQLCSLHSVVLNVEKSRVLLISRQKNCFTDAPILPQVESLKVLGLIINDKLNWSSHVDFICKKANQRLHILRKLKDLLPADELHLIYTSLIRSILEYVSPVFVGLNKKLSERLLKVDKRAHRIMAGSHPNSPDKSCNCDSAILSNRRLALSESLFRYIESSNTHILSSSLPLKLPNSGQYSVPFASGNRYFSSFFPFMARYLNSKMV